VRWAIEIQKTSLNTRNLSDLLRGLGFNLVEGIEYPALASPVIDACLTSADVFEKAKAVREALKGPAQIDTDFLLGSVIDYSMNPPRRHAFLEVESLVSTSTVSTCAITIYPPDGLSATELEQWHAEREEQQYQAKLERQRSKLEPAFYSPRAKKVLELLAIENPSGETIYKIYELAQGPAGNRENFHTQFGISKDQFNRFKDAVHSPEISGDMARHAYGHRPNTPNPMSLIEAKIFIRHIAENWLQSVRDNRSDL